MGKAVGEVAGQRRSRGDLGRGAEGEGKRKVDQSEGPGRGALEGHSQGKGPGKGVLTHWGGEGYACNPEGHTAAAVGKGTLRNKKRIIINTTQRLNQSHTQKLIVHHSVYSSPTCGVLRGLILRRRRWWASVIAHLRELCLGVDW